MAKELCPGDVVHGLYVVDRKVGEGAFGEVWSGTKTSTGEKVALKRMHRRQASDDELVARFRREAYFLSRVHSDYLAKVIDFVVDERFGMVLVMQFIEGELLSDLIETMRLPVEDAIDLGIDLLCGVRDLHAARVIHRDLKPANVMVHRVDENRHRAVIFDFSLSRLAERRNEAGAANEGSHTPSALSALTGANVTIGTLQYMAPEQVLNSRQVTVQSDLYSLGAILFRAIAGEHPFSEHEAARGLVQAKLTTAAPPLVTGRNDDVARELESIVDKALRRRPAERYANATEMLDALMRLHDVVMNAEQSRDTQRQLAVAGAESSSSRRIIHFERSLLWSSRPPPSLRSAGAGPSLATLRLATLAAATNAAGARVGTVDADSEGRTLIALPKTQRRETAETHPPAMAMAPDPQRASSPRVDAVPAQRSAGKGRIALVVAGTLAVFAGGVGTGIRYSTRVPELSRVEPVASSSSVPKDAPSVAIAAASAPVANEPDAAVLAANGVDAGTVIESTPIAVADRRPTDAPPEVTALARPHRVRRPPVEHTDGENTDPPAVAVRDAGGGEQNGEPAPTATTAPTTTAAPTATASATATPQPTATATATSANAATAPASDPPPTPRNLE